MTAYTRSNLQPRHCMISIARRICLFSVLVMSVQGQHTTITVADDAPITGARRPVALVALGADVIVANRRSGSLTVIDARTHRVVTEHRVARRIADIAAKPDGSGVLVLDDAQQHLLDVRITGSKDDRNFQTRVICALPVKPERMLLSSEQRRLFVTSRWDRSVTAIDLLADGDRPQRQHQIALGFPVQEMVLISQGKRLVAADAFGGRLAIINVQRAKLEFVRKLDAHNIRGLALSGDASKLYIAHQQINPTGWTDFDDVHWGTLMANSLRVLTISSLLNRDVDILQGGWLEKLGRTGHAAGDPGPVVIGARGTLAVALSGVGDVAVTRASYADRFHVGRRPVDLLIINDNLLIADQLSDSIARIDLRAGTVAEKISLGPSVAATARDRGEALFYNARLSHDGWMSCHSCHSEGHTIGQLADTLGDGDYGAPKRIPSLLGSGQTGPWAWNGGMTKLEEQVRKSVKTTMHGNSLSNDEAADLVAFLKSLTPPASRFHAPDSQLRQGRKVFAKYGCNECHTPPLYTSSVTVDVGLVDENGRRRFNPPSLRGLGQRDRFFHDGRVTRIEDVVNKSRHQLKNQKLSTADATALIAFLKSL